MKEVISASASVMTNQAAAAKFISLVTHLLMWLGIKKQYTQSLSLTILTSQRRETLCV